MSRDTRGALYLGLMTGTSVDAIDAVIVDFANSSAIVATAETPLPAGLRQRIQTLIGEPATVSLDELGHIGRELADSYATAVRAVLTAAGVEATAIRAIGCHGQTVRHNPVGANGFTLQIVDAAALAVATGIPVINDFRSADVALGGQGAPLVPAFHQHVFAAAGTSRTIINIGGIANITLLSAEGSVTGYDIGPGNTLLDAWCTQHLGKSFDKDGAWAASGKHDEALLDTLLTDAYFSMQAPKSTGREYFNPAWLQRYLNSLRQQPRPADVQATLAELTARSIAAAVGATAASEVYLCGGGAANHDLVERIAAALPDQTVATTAALGIAPEWVEAAAFAWLARARLREEPGNIPSVTGASRSAILGAVYLP